MPESSTSNGAGTRVFTFHKSASAGVEMSRRIESETCSTPRSTTSEPTTRTATTRVRSNRQRRRIESIGLRLGRVHSIWKPKQRSATGPTELEEVQARPIRRKESLYDRQRKVLARIQIAQQVLKTQQEELAATHSERGEEVGEEGGEGGRRKKLSTSSSSSLAVQPGLKWKRAIKTMIEEKSNKDKKKDVAVLSRRFHNLVSQQVAAMSKPSPKTLQDQEPDVFSPPAHTLTRRNRFSTRVVPIRQLRSGRSTEQATSPPLASPPLCVIAEEN